MSAALDGILFDKDGTLFDFEATWVAWAQALLQDLSRSPGHLQRLAESVAFDLSAGRFRPDSFAIAGTNRELAEALVQHLPDWTVPALEMHLAKAAMTAPLAPATPLGPLLTGLRQRGLRLGVMTNDTEATAQTHLQSADVLPMFDFVAGFDSGYGAKPDPAPLLAFAQQQALDPGRCAMVGDSTHDLLAGRAAGMVTVGVLTGMADTATLAPHADVVLPDIGALPEWLDARG